MPENIEIVGAQDHNLQHVTLRLPRHKMIVITGCSGSGKSSLAFDTLYAEGRRRYIATLPGYARRFIGELQRPQVDRIEGLGPVVSIGQKTPGRSARSTVGTASGIYDFLRVLFAKVAAPYSPDGRSETSAWSRSDAKRSIQERFANQRIQIWAPLVVGRKGHYRELFERLVQTGFRCVRVDGQNASLTPGMRLDRYKIHDVELLIDELEMNHHDPERLHRSLALAWKKGSGKLAIVDGAETWHFYAVRPQESSGQSSQPLPAPHLFSFNALHGACPACGGTGEVSERRDAGNSKTDLPGPLTAVCPICKGARLCQEALTYRIDGYNIAQLCKLNFSQLLKWTASLAPKLTADQRTIARQPLEQVQQRTALLLEIGLHYLTPDRALSTLSGGELQRIRIATQIGSPLVDVIYILDEPSIGLHQRDNAHLIQSLCKLRDAGNTVVIVEHDKDTMLAADYLVEMGPGAGKDGGRIVCAGERAEFLKSKSVTAQFLSDALQVVRTFTHSPASSPTIRLTGCRGNNLQNVSVTFPLGQLICVTGVSGSGKSSLIQDTLVPLLKNHLHRTHNKLAFLPCQTLEGAQQVERVVEIDQSPVGRTLRSNPATYTGLFTEIRMLFAKLPEAKMLGYSVSRFSFNAAPGRCPSCQGAGMHVIEMDFLPSVSVVCTSCRGSRYNAATLSVMYRGKNIADVLSMTVQEAAAFFEKHPSIMRKLGWLRKVGLGYMKLGQSVSSLSGGEAQRLKLSAELSARRQGNTFYVLDEPTTGLHFQDVQLLLNALSKLVGQGHTALLIEHNMDVIKNADYIIDMGPEGGDAGGQVVAQGTPSEIVKQGVGHTARFLQLEMQRS